MGKPKNVRELTEKAMRDCFKYSLMNIGDIFVSFSPHVNSVSFDVYKEGWGIDRDTDISVSITLKGILKPEISEAKKRLKPLYDYMKGGKQ
ncbi:hypothetical protein [uncultured Bacteroides sp.]|uniref:hypothetical protein n=1 Tax=uncultured Bacteroides sp. TaxID=162156 RepID=UPI002AAB8B6B|nr:hypothetical protein [uncultured Bacteroides sp.]